MVAIRKVLSSKGFCTDKVLIYTRTEIVMKANGSTEAKSDKESSLSRMVAIRKVLSSTDFCTDGVFLYSRTDNVMKVIGYTEIKPEKES